MSVFPPIISRRIKLSDMSASKNSYLSLVPSATSASTTAQKEKPALSLIPVQAVSPSADPDKETTQ